MAPPDPGTGPPTDAAGTDVAPADTADTEADTADADAAVDLATALLVAARGLEPRVSRRRGRRLSRLFDDDASMAFSLALTDQVARIADPRRAARRLHDLVATSGLPGFLGPVDRAVLRAGAALGRVAPGPISRGVRWRLRHESAGVVLPAEDPAFARYVARRRHAGISLNVNLLGEAILGDDEARRRLDDVMARIDRPDVDYVSVKVSSVCAQVSSLAFDRSVARITERLRLLYRRAAAADPPVFVNLDMEEYRDLELTLAVFTHVLSEPGLVGLDAGIVLQAYLPDSHAALDHIAEWATRRHARGGGRVKIRIVKGANLAMEQVDAELHGWPQAPYTTKAEVDASYKRLVEHALDPCWGDAVRVGLASHNLFDVAWGIGRAGELGAGHRLELEMLEGMAPGEAEAVRRRAGAILLYAPVVRRGEFDAAIAYLVRRLDENTSPENFLRHQFDLEPGSPDFVEQRDRFRTAVDARHGVGTTPRRTQDRGHEHRSFPFDAPFTNEPDTDWSIAANRAWLARHLAGDVTPAEPLPVMIGGEPLRSGTVAVGVDPSSPGAPLYRYTLADRAGVDRAVAVAVRAQEAWGSTTTTARARLLASAAEVLAAHRGEAIAVMARDTGKTVAESDPEVSEAVDMATWYAGRALGLDDLDAEHRPFGPVVVAPPWNFPFAIPAGGVLAALAAGDTVILKPAPESVLTAWLLATCLWDAGVPPDVFQFVPCPDDDVGRALVTHDGVAAVILTGSVDTAHLFLSWKPDLRLLGETSGKNAMVVTAAADLDLAVKDVVRSAFGHAGQKCSAASVVIVEQSLLDDGRFTARLADATRTLRVGPATDPSVDVGPLIAPPGDRLARALHDHDPGERWLVRPRRLDDAGHLWSPGIKLGVRPGSFLHRTECFGPVLAVMAARDLDHALELQNATDFGLTGGLHSLDPAEVARWRARVEVGNAYVNRSTTGAIVGRQPFGGWKRSAVGSTAKAGGPDYVASLCTWSDLPGDRLVRARTSYAAAWPDLSRPRDTAGLRAERNEHRHVPLASVVLRVEKDADPLDVDLCLLAARTTGTRVVLSRHGDGPDGTDETVAARARRWAGGAPDRLRVLGTVPDALRRAALDAGLALDDRAPVAEGRIELPRWSREQTVSVTNHRHGNTRAV
jgi:RHH-type proline utilization regulon transcriptional repressor/proline dehydrogenase/delta 1-pyrroline-5-carboxylate dehydrogenase